jgi:hypothetical protein
MPPAPCCWLGFLRAFAERDHGDDRADSDHDAEHREEGAHLVGAERAQRDGYGFGYEHGSVAPSAATAPATRGCATAATAAWISARSTGARHTTALIAHAGNHARVRLHPV